MSSNDTFDLPPDADGDSQGNLSNEGSKEALRPGVRVGSMQVMRLLGEGGMGQVWMARDLQLGRRVALKVIRTERQQSADMAHRFLREAKTTARFNHPHIVNVYSMGTHETMPWLALELIEGGTLRERLATGPMAPREAARVALGVSSALTHAHEQGVLHRDLKPENVLMGADGRVRVVDFGLASSFDAPTVSEEDTSQTTLASSAQGLPWCGSPPYMSPEQFRCDPLGPATDLWSLGILMAECLLGQRPFDLPGETVGTLMNRVLTLTAAPRLEGLPPGLADLIEGCLAPQARNRLTAAAAHSALEQFLSPRHHRDETTPFRGLAGYAEAHATEFFGRDDDIATLAEQLRTQPVLPLVGPSGAGKSSLVFGGLIPRLRERGPWLVLHVRPGLDPFGGLQSRLTRTLTNPGEQTSNASPRLPTPSDDTPQATKHAAPPVLRREDPRSLGRILRAEAVRRNLSILLVVDQLEELLTVAEESERMDYLRTICFAADDPLDPVRVVLTLRDDFLGRLAFDTEIARVLSRVYVVQAPGPASLQIILREPIQQRRYHWEDPEMVNELVAETHGLTACLPLLQVAGSLLWEQRNQELRLIPRRALVNIGGLRGALASHADRVLAGLTTPELHRTRRVILRLITPEHTRAVVPMPQALAELGDESAGILDRLIEHRLVNRRRSRHGESVVELSHESLITHWDQLRRWLEESRSEIRLEADLQIAAALWQRLGSPADGAWTGERGQTAREAHARGTLRLTPGEKAFMEAGQIWEGRQQQRRKGLLAGGLFLTGLVMLSLGSAVVSERRTATAERARTADVKRESLRREAAILSMTADRTADEGQWMDALALSLAGLAVAKEANDSHETAQLTGRVSRFLTSGLARHDITPAWEATPIGFVKISPDGAKVAIGQRGAERLEIWDLATGSQDVALPACKATLHGGDWSADGRFIAQNCLHELGVEVWDPVAQTKQDLQCSSRASGDDRGILQWHADQLYVGGSDSVCIYSGEPLELVAKLPTEDQVARLKVNDNWIAAGPLYPTPGRPGLHVWDRVTQELHLDLPHLRGTLRSLALSEDHVGVRSTNLKLEGNSYEVWSLTSPPQRVFSADPMGWNATVAFSEDGEHFVSTEDKVVTLREASTAVAVPRSSHLADGQSQFVFSPSGRILAEVSWEGLVRFVHTESGVELARDQVQTARVLPVGFIGEDQFVAFSQRTGLSIWDLSSLPSTILVTPEEALLTGHNSSGTWTVTESGSVVYQQTPDSEPTTLGRHPSTEGITSLNLGHDSAYTQDDDGKIWSWRRDEPGPRWSQKPEQPIAYLSVAPNDSHVALATEDGWLLVLDDAGDTVLERQVASGREVFDQKGRSHGSTDSILSIPNWSPDGQWLIAEHRLTGERVICATENWRCNDVAPIIMRGGLVYDPGGESYYERAQKTLSKRSLPSGDLVWSREPKTLAGTWSGIAVRGDQLVLGSSAGQLMTWTTEGEFLGMFSAGNGMISQLDVSEDGRLLPIINNMPNRLELWDTELGVPIQVHAQPGWSYSLYPSGSGTTAAWANAMGRAVLTLPVHAFTSTEDVVSRGLAATNRRVCRKSQQVVEVTPFPTDDNVWAPESDCAPAAPALPN